MNEKRLMDLNKKLRKIAGPVDVLTRINSDKIDLIHTDGEKLAVAGVNGVIKFEKSSHKNNALVEALGLAGIRTLSIPKQQMNPKAINWGNAGHLSASLRGLAGTGEVKTTIEYLHKDKKVRVTTNNYELSRDFIHLFIDERRAEFGGSYGLSFWVQLPDDLAREPLALFEA